MTRGWGIPVCPLSPDDRCRLTNRSDADTRVGAHMSFAVRLRKSWLLSSLVVGATTVHLLTTALAKVASAHGAVIDPPTRNYGCLERWRNNHMAPEMRTEDPMCYEAYRVNPNAMWNWNAVFRENVRGNHQAAIPDGTLCS